MVEIGAVVTFLMIFEAHINILFIVELRRFLCALDNHIGVSLDYVDY